jgi:hypothetical protein
MHVIVVTAGREPESPEQERYRACGEEVPNVHHNRHTVLTSGDGHVKLSIEPMSTTHSGHDSAPAFTADGLDATELREAVTAAARGLRYGSIEVVIHDARIVQIIRTEKRRIVR